MAGLLRGLNSMKTKNMFRRSVSETWSGRWRALFKRDHITWDLMCVFTRVCVYVCMCVHVCVCVRCRKVAKCKKQLGRLLASSNINSIGRTVSSRKIVCSPCDGCHACIEKCNIISHVFARVHLSAVARVYIINNRAQVGHC